MAGSSELSAWVRQWSQDGTVQLEIDVNGAARVVELKSAASAAVAEVASVVAVPPPDQAESAAEELEGQFYYIYQVAGYDRKSPVLLETLKNLWREGKINGGTKVHRTLSIAVRGSTCTLYAESRSSDANSYAQLTSKVGTCGTRFRRCLN